MKVFISDLNGYLGRALRRRLAGEDDVQIIGTVASLDDVPSKVAKSVEVRELAG
jgi:nucleoside-diphosphate-sugar epimerase